MTKKKDDNYYKKQYKKLKKQLMTTEFKIKEHIYFYQGIIAVLCKRAPDGKIVVTLDELKKMQNHEKAHESFQKNKSVTFEIGGK